MKPSQAKKNDSSDARNSRFEHAGFWLSLSLVVLVPLAFSTAVYNIFSLPKFALLLTGSSLLIPALAWNARRTSFERLKSRHALIVSLYVIAIAISTLFGVAPRASLFGSNYGRMGLITHLSFFLCFIALVTGIGTSEKRLFLVLRAMAVTGFIVAAYGFIQFFGHDVFLSPDLYTLASEAGPVLRVAGTLGHANYLGNFLLYTTPLTAGLAMVSSGSARRLAITASVVSVIAIAFSGTRGAWLGILAAAITFAGLELYGRSGDLLRTRRRALVKRAGLTLIAITALVAIITLNPASRNITARARQFMSDGFTGAGRTLLWRDSLRMVPRYGLTGCGPEGFRKAFLAYKSEDLALYSPLTNNESSHNSYLDAAISFGLPGAIAYIAIIASIFALLIRVRRRFASRRMKVIATGLLSSIAAVAVHNFFIFDQISTGLYFYALAALALASANLAANRETSASRNQASKGEMERASFTPAKTVFTFVGLLVAVMSGWYVWSLVRADAAIKQAFEAANAGDSDRVASLASQATGAIDPTSAYDFLFARALMLSADQMEASGETRDEIIKLAMRHAEKSLPYTLMPDSDSLLLAYLALQIGDVERLGVYAEEAMKWDPNFSNTHWLMAESLLARGENERAAIEARRALHLFPGALEARGALKRARKDAPTKKRNIEEMLAHAIALRDSGKPQKAKKVLRRAIRRSGGTCPACHRALAQVYESDRDYEKAIAEWEAFIKETTDREDAGHALLRVESLRQKLLPK